jgi:glycosyltransferase involved in cell wall biosynthesis
MNSRGRLCFYVPYLYPVAADGEIPFVGGSEVRHWALARAMADRGFEVTAATCDYGQGPLVRKEGVSLVRTYSTTSGVPGVRFFYPRLWKAMKTMHDADADVYLASGAGLPAGWTYDASRRRRAAFVFLAAHDADAMAALPLLTTKRERWWYRRALRGADARVAQTDAQRRLFRESFAVEAQVIPNPVDVPSVPVDAGANRSILWVATYKPSKRPEWFLELARRLPQHRFTMIGYPPRGESTPEWREASRAAADLENLDVFGFVEHSRIGEFLRDAALFVHTSPLEGFPNALLEAWAHGVPSVTTVDPGGVIADHGIGSVVETLDGLEQAVAALMEAPERRRMLGMRAQAYVENHHGPEQAYEPLADLLDAVIEGRTSRRPPLPVRV